MLAWEWCLSYNVSNFNLCDFLGALFAHNIIHQAKSLVNEKNAIVI